MAGTDIDPVRAAFERGRSRGVELAARFVDDAEAVMDEAAERFERMIPDMAYVDDPEQPMAYSVFVCSAALALYLSLRERGVDVHEFGSAFLAQLVESPPPPPDTSDDRSPREQFAEFLKRAELSQQQAKANEFVYEAAYHGTDELDWSMNVKSCAICHAFARHDAMELVPYMCATDDVVSDQLGQGLRRSGTIALGAPQCDFRYKKGGEPVRVAEQYPEKIRLKPLS